MERYIETVKAVDGEMKIRDYLKKRLGLSTALIGKVKYDNVKLNGEYVHMRAMVKNGDFIEITLPDEESENIEPMDIPLEIVFEDDYVIAVNKPKNMPVHPSRGNHLPTVANCIMHYVGHPFVFRLGHCSYRKGPSQRSEAVPVYEGKEIQKNLSCRH